MMMMMSVIWCSQIKAHTDQTRSDQMGGKSLFEREIIAHTVQLANTTCSSSQSQAQPRVRKSCRRRRRSNAIRSARAESESDPIVTLDPTATDSSSTDLSAVAAAAAAADRFRHFSSQLASDNNNTNTNSNNNDNDTSIRSVAANYSVQFSPVRLKFSFSSSVQFCSRQQRACCCLSGRRVAVGWSTCKWAWLAARPTNRLAKSFARINDGAGKTGASL